MSGYLNALGINNKQLHLVVQSKQQMDKGVDWKTGQSNREMVGKLIPELG
jgi:hypothetical protein